MKINHLQNLCETFGQQPNNIQNGLERAWNLGFQIQYCFEGVWKDCTNPGWNSKVSYRISPDEVCLYNLNKPLKELTRKVRLELFDRWFRGEELEQLIHYDWTKVLHPDWDKCHIYRLAEPVVLPSIEWDQVNERYNYLYTTVFGNSFLSSTPPEFLANDSVRTVFNHIKADTFTSFKAGDVHGEASIVVRPGYENPNSNGS